MYKAKQSQDWKRLKLVNVRIEKRNVVLRVTSASEKHAFFFFFFLVYYTHVIVYWEHARRGSLEKKYHWESTTFPRISILPVVKVRGSTILLAGGLQREPGVDITVWKGIKYLEDQNRRYGRDKMPLLSVEFSNCVKAPPNKYWTIRDKKDVRVSTFLLAA